MKKAALIFLFVLLSLSCSGVPALFAPTPTPTQTSTPSPTFTPTPSPTSTPTPTATIRPPLLTPEAGFSNVYGRVLWHGEAVAGFGMHLQSADIISYYEHVVTDREGRFVFENVPPGAGYSLNPYRNSDHELAGITAALSYTFDVPAEVNFSFGDYPLAAVDLLLVNPVRDAELSEMPPRLSWEAYPGAAYYVVELKQVLGTYTDMVVQTEDTSLELELPLLDCIYGWDVTAYDAGGVPLARSDIAYEDKAYDFYQKYDGIFTISNPDLPWCRLEILHPLRGQELQGGGFELVWGLHPLAVRYELIIDKSTGEFLTWNPYTHKYEPGNLKQDFGWYVGTVEVNADGTLGDPNPPLPYFGTGDYDWEINAYTADGGFIASASSYFSVP